jgi:hypothetical protein
MLADSQTDCFGSLAGSRRASDTNILRPLQYYLFEQYVQSGRSQNRHFQMVRKNRDPFDKLLGQNASLSVIRFDPDDPESNFERIRTTSSKRAAMS